MKRKLHAIWMAVAAVCAAAPAAARAAQGDVREIVVAKDATGDVRTIRDALAQIQATPDAPWRITVKPGTYEESIVLKPYVQIVGGGRGNTRIVSSGETDPTVLMTTASSLADMSVEKSGSAREEAPAIMIGTSDQVTIERVRAEGSFGAILFGTARNMPFVGRVAISDTVAVGRTNFGIRIGYYGTYDVSLDRVTGICEGVNVGDECHGVSLWLGGGAITLRASNSTFRGNQAFVNYGLDRSSARFTACDFEASGASGPSQENVAVFAHEGATAVSSSRLHATGLASRGAIVGEGASLGIHASEISGETAAVNAPIAGTMKIGVSRVAGAIEGAPKLAGCHDGNLDPIPDGTPAP